MRTLAIAGLVVSTLAMPALGQVSGNRSLPGSCPTGSEISVAIDLTVDGQSTPNGVILIEQLPSGWELVSATPEESSFNPDSGEVRWVFFGDSVSDTGMDVAYVARPPQGAADAQAFTGTVRFNDSTGNQREVTLQGGNSCSASGTSGAPLSGTRNLPDTCPGGDEIDVDLDVEVEDGRAPNGVIVVEVLPRGWSLANADPAADSFDPASGEARWVFFGTSVDDAQMDIRYTAEAPDDTSAPQVFAGTLRYNDAGGASQELTIEGQNVCHGTGPDDPIPPPNRPNNPGTDASDGGGGGCTISSGSRSAIGLWWLLPIAGLVLGRRWAVRRRPADRITAVRAVALATMIAAGIVAPGASIGVQAQSHPADTDGNGRIDDFELLAYIDRWAERAVSDFELLDAIDIWADGPRDPTITPTPEPEDPTPTFTRTPTRTPTPEQPDTVAMTLSIADGCFDGDGIQFRLFDVDNRLVWPDSSRVFILDPGGSAALTIACYPNARICYGAVPRNDPTRYWGIGIDGDESCADCCYRCAPVTAPTWNLIC